MSTDGGPVIGRAGSSELVLVAAMDRNNAIGADGGLPWHLPDDFARFKQRTLDGIVVMGRRTAQSLPFALPRRRNLVLTRGGGDLPYPQMEAVSSWDDAEALADSAPLLVIGGGEVYVSALPRASQLWLTHVDIAVVGADTWFPTVDPQEWEVSDRSRHLPDDRHPVAFEFVDYRRRHPWAH